MAMLAFRTFVAGWNISGNSADCSFPANKQQIPNNREKAAQRNGPKIRAVVVRGEEMNLLTSIDRETGGCV
jgi:hypothetical protein